MQARYTAAPPVTIPGVTHLWEIDIPSYRNENENQKYYRGVAKGSHGGQLPVAAKQYAGGVSLLQTGWSDLDQIRLTFEYKGLEELKAVDPCEIFLPAESWIIAYHPQQQEGTVRLTVIPTVGNRERQRLFTFSEAWCGRRYRIHRESWMIGKLVLDRQGEGCYYHDLAEIASYMRGDQAQWMWGGTKERYRLFEEIYTDL